MIRGSQFIIALLFLGLLSACAEEYPDIGPYPSKIEGINGDWILTGVEQIDEKIQFESLKARDVSSVFVNVQTPTTMSFDTVNFTYTYIAGDNPAYLPESGTWAFVNTEFPDYSWQFPDEIMFKDAMGTEFNYALQGPVRPQDKYLTFKIERGCFVDPDGISYILKFERN